MEETPARAHAGAGFAARWDDSVDRIFAVVQRLLLAGVAVALVVLSVMALWDTIVLVRDELAVHDVTRAITVGVDTVFLTVILLELLHTVISRGTLAQQAPEFIIIGITSAIRHGLGLVASGSGTETVTRVIQGHRYRVSLPGSGSPRDIVINLAINAGGVLILVAALWLVRSSLGTHGHMED